MLCHPFGAFHAPPVPTDSVAKSVVVYTGEQGTPVHLPGAADHGGHLLDDLEAGDGHNETSHFTQLLEPSDLAGAVVTADALHTVRANLAWGLPLAGPAAR